MEALKTIVLVFSAGCGILGIFAMGMSIYHAHKAEVARRERDFWANELKRIKGKQP
jgi:hypothetical protein